MLYVVKFGGGKEISLENIAEDFGRHRMPDYQVIFGSGGGEYTSDRLIELTGKDWFVRTSSGKKTRYTPAEVLSIFSDEYKKIALEFASLLNRHGTCAAEYSGAENGLLIATWEKLLRYTDQGKRFVARDNLAGVVTDADTFMITSLLRKGITPIIHPPATGHDEDGNISPVNADGDISMAVVAYKMHADTYIMLTNVPGLLKDVNDNDSLIRKMPKYNISEYSSYAEGRMQRKLEAAQIALSHGVRRVIIADGRVPLPIIGACQGYGTEIS
jgi:[amino group carrier protein]-L-2-aminoadipate 6-kinase